VTLDIVMMTRPMTRGYSLFVTHICSFIAAVCRCRAIWLADGVLIRFMNIFVSTWVLVVVGLLCALPVLYYRVEYQVIARMDDTGHVMPVEEFEQE